MRLAAAPTTAGAWLLRLALPAGVLWAIFSGYRLDAPWPGGDEGYAGAQHQAIARHLLALGPERCGAAQLRVFHPVPSNQVFDAAGRVRGPELRSLYGDRFWTSRLPLVALGYAGALRLGGDRELSVRLVSWLSVALLLGAIGLFGPAALGRNVTAGWLIVLALTPGTILLSRLAGYELPCLALTVTALLLHENWRRGRGGFFAAWLAALGAGLLGWYGLFAALLMAGDLRPEAGATGRAGRWLRRFGLAVIPLIVVGLYAAYLAHLGQPLSERLEYFWRQRSLGGAAWGPGGPTFAAGTFAADFSLVDYFYRIQKFLVNHLTPLPLILAAGWAFDWLRRRRRGEAVPEARLAGKFLFLALLVYLLALRASYVHRYYVLWWLPLVGLTAGGGLARLAAGRRSAWLAGLLIAGLLGSAGYKTWSYHAKNRPAEAEAKFMRRAAKLIGPDAEVAGLGVGKLTPSRRPDRGPGAGEVEIDYDPGDPRLFYLWRAPRTSLLVYYAQGPNGSPRLRYGADRPLYVVGLGPETDYADCWDREGMLVEQILARSSGGLWRLCPRQRLLPRPPPAPAPEP